ncbi:hypothetical protein [Dyella telluris]|uniref:Lipoprotein n=1 Tax=Dyella telluris TaxID=2763498 RepID=A0A7G8Q6E6_9GAMM|nr:hypothetical protein [Dyella telluris]QNK02354.1 hypothetical protein H8F01_04185 [Dyella telluris]
MKFHRHRRLALLALVAGGVILAGCSNKPETRPSTTTHGSTTAASGSHAATSGTSGTTRTRTGTVTTSGGKPLPNSTGIPACDDYLASYVSCHAAAGVYPADQIQSRYEDMRTSLLQDSVDPTTRPQLGARCAALAKQLRATLQGKSCGPASPAAASGGSH